jgi:hypothetical protein
MYLFTYTGLPTRFSCSMIFVSFNSNTTGATSGVGTVYPISPFFSAGFMWLNLNFYLFYRPLFVISS